MQAQVSAAETASRHERRTQAGRSPARPETRVLGTSVDKPACKGSVAPPRALGSSGRVSAGDAHSEVPQDGRGDGGPPAIPVVQARQSRVSQLSPSSPISNSQADSTCLCFSVLADRLAGEARVGRGLVACPQSTFLLMSCCGAFSLLLDLDGGRGEMGAVYPKESLSLRLSLSLAHLDWLTSCMDVLLPSQPSKVYVCGNSWTDLSGVRKGWPEFFVNWYFSLD